VPDFFLQETVQAAGKYIVEEPFYPLPEMPSPILGGIDVATLPALYGYNGATPKGTARVALGTPRGDPLLATWQIGLGRAAAWTSDLKAQWAVDWVSWEGFPRFAAQLVSWVLPAPQVEGLSARVDIADEASARDDALVRVEALDQASRPRNFLDVTATLVGPDMAVRETTLSQVGAGLYEARAELGEPGAYLVRVTAREGEELVGQQILGLVVPYSPEYTAPADPGGEGGWSVNRALLEALARRTGGGELPEPPAAFTHNLPAADRAREVWRALLLVAVLFFPLDVAIRRVMLGPRDVRKAWDWMGERLPARRARAGRERGDRPERVLGELFDARRRARTRRASPPPAVGPSREEQREQATSPLPAPPPESPGQETGQSPSPGMPAEDGDVLTRLREAKRRARRNS